MSLYIKGINLPKKGRYTSFTVYSDGKVVYRIGGDPAGEAIPVPPHGRLIDADALERDFREDAEDAWNKEASPISWADAFSELADMVADAPTIIPAEEGET